MKKIVTFLLLFVTLITVSKINFSISASQQAVSQIRNDIKSHKKLSDNNHHERYDLYEFIDTGYLIYDNLSNEICEYSTKSKSPYTELYDDLYYFGPTTYSQKKNKILVDVYTGNETSYYKDLNQISRTNHDSYSIYDRNSSTYEIPFSFYFKLLDGTNNVFPINIDNDCGYVAASIILSYFDCFYNDSFVADSYISTVNNTSFNYTQWTNIPCANLNFKNMLHNYSNSSTYLTTAYSITEIISSYLNEKTSIRNYSSFIDTLPSFSNIISALNRGFPLILFGNFIYQNVDVQEEVTNHAIISYGYTNEEGNRFILSHLGRNDLSNVWVNYAILEDTITGSLYQLNVNNLTHSHSNNFMVNGHLYCPIDEIHIGIYEKIYEQYSTTQHSVRCTCGLTIGFENHEFINSNLLAVPGRHKTCSKCGYIISSII